MVEAHKKKYKNVINELKKKKRDYLKRLTKANLKSTKTIIWKEKQLSILYRYNRSILFNLQIKLLKGTQSQNFFFIGSIGSQECHKNIFFLI